jgi:hypothetical protein
LCREKFTGMHPMKDCFFLLETGATSLPSPIGDSNLGAAMSAA